jgi:hypothetical protein
MDTTGSGPIMGLRMKAGDAMRAWLVLVLVLLGLLVATTANAEGRRKRPPICPMAEPSPSELPSCLGYATTLCRAERLTKGQNVADGYCETSEAISWATLAGRSEESAIANLTVRADAERVLDDNIHVFIRYRGEMCILAA